MTTTPRSRILIVTRNLPPLVGGMERLNWHMAEELAKVADVRIVAPQGSAALAPANVPVREVPLRPLWKFLLQARRLARREARAWRPDVVLAGSGLTAPIVRSAARTCGARTAAYVHGLDVAVKHPVYRALWLPAIRHMDRVIANSRATAELCRSVGVDPARIGIVHPGVEIQSPPALAGGPAGPTASTDAVAASAAPTAHIDPSRSLVIPAQAGIHFERPAGPVLLSVGRLSARKGLREFVTHALPRIVATHPDVTLLIVGDAPKDALRADAQSPESIRAAAANAGVADNLRFLGRVSDAGLAALYGMADVHVFPVRDVPGDPEGFGMVAVEAAAHGVPTVAFASGGVPDAVAEGRSGYVIAPGDYAALADAVLRILASGDAMHATSIAFAQQFAWSTFGSQVAAQLVLRHDRNVDG